MPNTMAGGIENENDSTVLISIPVWMGTPKYR